MSDEPTADEHPHHAPQGSGTAARRSIPATRGALSEPVVPDPTAPGAAPNTERVATSGASQPAPDPHADDKHLAELTLDVLVYAPTGLLLMAVEEFPELAAKGRQKINRQLNNAKFIGKMAVTIGGREMRQRVEGLTSSAPTTPPGATDPGPRSTTPGARPPATSRTTTPPVHTPAAATTDPPPPSAPSAVRPATERTAGPVAGTPGTPGEPEAPRDLRDAPRPIAPRPVRPAAATASSASGERPRVDLAIPGYDTLSASQVVRRLDSLGRDELLAVERYETGSRHRRTILHRVAQLLGEEEAPGSPGG